MKEGVDMTVIAQDVFTMAMNLMDEESEDGTYAGYPEEYKNKAWSILSLLQAELLPVTVAPLAVTNELSVMQIDDRTSVTVLPYGLAAHLLMTEDHTRAAFFNARYDKLKRKQPATITTIKDVYGIAPKQADKTPGTVTDYEGGSFLDPKSGTYDGGEF
jgi:hypothetical protein